MIRFENICWRAGRFVLGPVSFDVPAGSYAVLTGRTGCGKTTLAEILCGLRDPASGRVWIHNAEVTHLEPALRGIGYVPQDGALFPTMTVRENLGFAPRLKRQSRQQTAAQVEQLASLLGISALLERLPDHLSGGERQRVALGRALAAKPAALVLDEPLSALDEQTHSELVILLKQVQTSLGLTALHITHHKQEATALGDCHFRLENGAVTEIPLEERAREL
jgi:molybdate/tungstate transport system ATP-binding protein